MKDIDEEMNSSESDEKKLERNSVESDLAAKNNKRHDLDESYE